MSNSNPTAAETYAERSQDIAAILGWLNDELEAHAERAKAEPNNWGLPGDLGYVRQKTKELLACLSAIGDEQIEEALAELRM